MLSKKNTLHFHKDYLLVYITFFLFFLIVTPITSSAQLYFIQSGKPSLFKIFLIINSISMIVIPPIIPYFTSRINGYAFIAIFIALAVALLIIDNFLFGNEIAFIFFIPFLTRIFNNVLVPFLAKSTTDVHRPSIFAVRDIFLNLGISAGFLLLSFSSTKKIFSPFFSLSILSVLVILLFLFLFLLLNQRKAKTDNSFLMANDIKKDSFNFLKSLKGVRSKKYLLIILVISIFTGWISISVSYLPGYIQSEGYIASSIFETYGFSYIAVSILGFVATLIPTKNNKNWYLFDLLFDVIPFSILAFVPGQTALIIGLVLLQLKDFVAPLSLSYFFELFNEKEYEVIWGINASLSSIISLGIPLIVNWVFDLNPTYIVIISIGMAIVSGFIALTFLPKKEKDNYLPE